MSARDQEMLAREYTTSERLERRRHDTSGWIRGEEAWDEALAAVCNRVLYHLADLDAGVAELARVLRPGGRFGGVYDRDLHMEELSARVRAEASAGQDHEDVLARHFARVQSRDTDASTLWRSREDLQELLDAFAELMGPLEAPAEPYPFEVTRRNRVYVAQKAA